jgi:hypothetical protein
MDQDKDFVIVGNSICEFAKPLNEVRWITRSGERVLQQAWVAQHISLAGYVTYSQTQWRDVPLVVGEQTR